MDYINRLDNYDGDELAKIALEEQSNLFDEALCIYKKFNMPVDAIRVIIDKMQNIKMATEYAEKTNKPAVWTELGKAQLNLSNLSAAIDAFIKANDPSQFERVIELSYT